LPTYEGHRIWAFGQTFSDELLCLPLLLLVGEPHSDALITLPTYD